jgi:hypothetical protein
MVTLAAAGPLIVIGVYQVTSGNSAAGSETLPIGASLFLAIVSLSAFIISVGFALYGLISVAALNVWGGLVSRGFFVRHTVMLAISMVIFLVGILMAFALLLFSA